MAKSEIEEFMLIPAEELNSLRNKTLNFDKEIEEASSTKDNNEQLLQPKCERYIISQVINIYIFNFYNNY